MGLGFLFNPLLISLFLLLSPPLVADLGREVLGEDGKPLCRQIDEKDHGSKGGGMQRSGRSLEGNCSEDPSFPSL